MEKNHKNLKKTIVIIYVVGSILLFWNLLVRIHGAEKTLEDRKRIVDRYLTTESSVLEIKRDIDLILRHHLVLMEDTENGSK